MVQGAAEALPADGDEVFSAHESACLDLSRRIQLHAGARLRAQRPAAGICAHHLVAMHRTFSLHAVQDGPAGQRRDLRHKAPLLLPSGGILWENRPHPDLPPIWIPGPSKEADDLSAAQVGMEIHQHSRLHHDTLPHASSSQWTSNRLWAYE